MRTVNEPGRRKEHEQLDIGCSICHSTGGYRMKILAFHFMVVCFAVRDRLNPPRKALAEAGVQPGFHLLDYGCGPGGYSLAAAELVGPSGKVHALDINPLAVRRVKKLASRRRLGNIETICSDCATGLSDSSMDMVLLYDTCHELGNAGAVPAELHRILKPHARLSVSDHHMNEHDIISAITGDGLFEMSTRQQETYTFLRA